MELMPYLKAFATKISGGEIEIYNEAGIQCELAIFLRNILPSKYKIQLERNINYFGFNKGDFLKKEMDIVIYTPDKTEKYCIELKFPTNGQYPEQMFSACKDINFLEQLVKYGFTSCYFIMFANDHLFYIDQGNEGIYKIFRKDKLIRGEIRKPTGEKEEVLHLNGEYKIEWQTLNENLKYFIIEVKK